ncbi:hypothetical protein [Micromonospora sp. KC723]|uniref:hypothetical protein n=1 Tax=Micromonospora sp. KC723 TaxID=2530381 RepID=UPI0010515A74|nr:hypothetical protein [Micromonospora sp. KC723]TDB77185.1 hypothetical protein E1165_04665 [Micromonospora sp. KC723]
MRTSVAEHPVGRLTDAWRTCANAPVDVPGLDRAPERLARHEVTLVELTPVVDETPPWWDEGRLLGRPGREEEA